MLFFLGLDSEFALLETSLTALYDGFPTLRSHKVKVTALGCIACFLMGLPCVSSNGQYVLDLMDTYGAGFAVLWIALWEVVALMWIYGFKNFSKDIALMIGSEPMFFTKICWVVFCPIILLVIFVMALYFWEQPTYSGSVSEGLFLLLFTTFSSLRERSSITLILLFVPFPERIRWLLQKSMTPFS